MSAQSPSWTELLSVIAFIIVTVISFMVAKQRDDLKAEAVQRGFAEWETNPHGVSTWKWKTSVPNG
jgi:hypothetical protein